MLRYYFKRFSLKKMWLLSMGLLILMAFWQVGEGLVYWIALPLPGSVVGMLLIWGALAMKVLPLQWISETVDLLLKHLALFFIPPGVGLLREWGLITENMYPILLAAIGGSLLVFAVTGWVYQWQVNSKSEAS